MKLGLFGGAAILVALLLALLAYVVGPKVALQKAATSQARAQVIQATAQGQLNTQATQVASREVIHEQAIQTTLPVIERRIAAAPGSDDLVAPASADAFFDGVCQYRPDDPACRPQDPGRPGSPPAVSPSGPAGAQD